VDRFLVQIESWLRPGNDISREITLLYVNNIVVVCVV